MKRAYCIPIGLALMATLVAQTVGKRTVGWSPTVTELLSLTPSKDAYVYVTMGNLYQTNYDGLILAYSPTATNAANLTNVWEPDSGIGRWFLIQGSGATGGGGGGSIGLTMPSGFSVSGSPVVGSGTLAVTMTNQGILKGTGSGFSNAVAGVDYAPAGAIQSSGLTMGGTNLLGRFSSGTGAIQVINLGAGLTMSNSVLSASGSVGGGTNNLYTTDGTLTGNRVLEGAGTNSLTFQNTEDFVVSVQTFMTWDAKDLYMSIGRQYSNLLTAGFHYPLTVDPDTGRVDFETNAFYPSFEINPTEDFIPVRSSGQLADSRLKDISGIGTSFMHTNVAQWFIGTRGNILSGKAAVAETFPYNITLFGLNSYTNQGGLLPEIYLVDHQTNSTSSVDLNARFPSPGISVNHGTNGESYSVFVDPFRIYMSGQSTTGLVSIVPYENFAGDAPFHFESQATTGTNLVVFKIGASNAFKIHRASNWQDSGTNIFTDNGKFRSISDLGLTPLTINPSDGYLPYRSNSTTFGNSPWYRVDTNQLGFNTTSVTYSSKGNNTLIGLNSGIVATGTNNIVIGSHGGIAAGGNISSGEGNTVIGPAAARFLTSGTLNVGVGQSALLSVVGQSQMVGIGYQSDPRSDGDVAIGTASKTGSGGQNVSIGNSAGSAATTGDDNVFIGASAASLATTASDQIAIGTSAGRSNLVGAGSVFIGLQAGASYTNSQHNVVIGHRAGNESFNRLITNSISIGNGATAPTNNTAQIGSGGVFALYINGTVGWFRGTGAPTSHASAQVTNAPVGSMYSREDGGGGTSFYVVETSAGNWVAK